LKIENALLLEDLESEDLTQPAMDYTERLQKNHAKRIQMLEYLLEAGERDQLNQNQNLLKNHKNHTKVESQQESQQDKCGVCQRSPQQVGPLSSCQWECMGKLCAGCIEKRATTKIEGSRGGEKAAKAPGGMARRQKDGQEVFYSDCSCRNREEDYVDETGTKARRRKQEAVETAAFHSQKLPPPLSLTMVNLTFEQLKAGESPLVDPLEDIRRYTDPITKKHVQILNTAKIGELLHYSFQRAEYSKVLELVKQGLAIKNPQDTTDWSLEAKHFWLRSGH
jgi:hypothetical protein